MSGDHGRVNDSHSENSVEWGRRRREWRRYTRDVLAGLDNRGGGGEELDASHAPGLDLHVGDLGTGSARWMVAVEIWVGSLRTNTSLTRASSPSTSGFRTEWREVGGEGS